VFALVSDPLGMGYIESLARPNGNITGFMSYDPALYTKQLQMFTEITPPPQPPWRLFAIPKPRLTRAAC
jgi:putative tryptophan/tyrosine transport system substrate-binding protein